MRRDRLAKSLAHLGIDPVDYRVLKLLPLVYTAWAGGTIEPVAARRIEQMARREFELSAQGMKVLEGWLAAPLSREYVVEGLRDLYQAAQVVDDMEVELSDLPLLIAHAEAIARSTGRGMDRPESVAPAGTRALHDIAALLQVDSGETWSELLAELERPAATELEQAAGGEVRRSDPER